MITINQALADSLCEGCSEETRREKYGDDLNEVVTFYKIQVSILKTAWTSLNLCGDCLSELHDKLEAETGYRTDDVINGGD